MWHVSDSQNTGHHCLVLDESSWYDRDCSDVNFSVCQIMSSKQCQQSGLFHQMSALKETIAEARQETKGENEFCVNEILNLAKYVILFEDCYQT